MKPGVNVLLRSQPVLLQVPRHRILVERLNTDRVVIHQRGGLQIMIVLDLSQSME